MTPTDAIGDVRELEIVPANMMEMSTAVPETEVQHSPHNPQSDKATAASGGEECIGEAEAESATIRNQALGQETEKVGFGGKAVDLFGAGEWD